MNNKGKIFSVRYVKKDGTTRFMKCRTGVKSKLKGGELAFDPQAKGLKVVFDMVANGYRMINLNTIYELRIGNKTYLGENARKQIEQL